MRHQFKEDEKSQDEDQRSKDRNKFLKTFKTSI